MDRTKTVKEKNGRHQHFVEHCFDKIEDIEKSEYRQEEIRIMKEAHRIYRQLEPKTDKFWPNESKVVLPLLTITVDNEEPRLVAGLVGKAPYVSFEMDGMTEKDQETEILEDFFNQELKHTVGIEDVASTITHNLLLEGTVYPICEYDEDEVIRRDLVFEKVPFIDPHTGTPAMDPQTGQVVTEEKVRINEETGKPVTEDTVDHIFRGGRVSFADFTDVFVADDADEWEKADVFRVVRKTYGDLMLLKDRPGYMNIDESLLDEVVKNEGETDEDMKSPAESVELAKKIANKTIELYECSVSYVFRDEDEEDEDVEDWTPTRYVALITKESKTLIRFIPLLDLNYKNEHLIKRIRLNPEPGKAYGNSRYKKLRAIQNGSTDMFNLSANIATLIMMPWFFYTDAANMPGEVKLELGGGVKVDDTNQIKFPEFRQNPRNFMPFIEMFLNMWQKEGSIGDIQTGQISEKNRDVTAAETMASIQEGNIKHNYQTISLKNDFNTVLRTLWDLYYQKMPYDSMFIYKGQMIKVPRSAMRRRYKFKLTGSTDLSNKVIEMQKAEGMYKSLRQDPISNPVKLIEDFVRTHMPDAVAEEYINPTVNEVMNMIQEYPQLMEIIKNFPQQVQAQEDQKESAKAQQEMQIKQAQAQQDMKLKEQKSQQDAQTKQAKAKLDAQVKEKKTAQDIRLREEKAEQDMKIKLAQAQQQAALKRQQESRPGDNK